MKYKEYKHLLKRRYKKGVDKHLKEWTFYDVILNWYEHHGYPTPF